MPRKKRNTNLIDVPLYGEQATIMQDWLTTEKHCIDIVPVGSGKTFLASVALPLFASDEKYHKGKDIIYSAPTGSMIKSLIWEPLKQSCIEHFGLRDGKEINNSELTIKFPNGVFIRCKSAEMKENLRGLNVGIWVADEAALYSQDTLQEITNRLRPRVGSPDTQGRLIVISTPNGNGPLFDLFTLANNNPDRYIVRHMNYLEMRSGNLEFIEEQKRILSPLKFEQDYMCSWESVQDQFFYTFNKAKHCHDIFDDLGDIYTFHDFNKKRMCCTVAQVTRPGERSGKIEILKSYAIKDCGTEQLAQQIRQDYPRRRIYSIIDMSGAQTNRDTTSVFGVTDRVILEKYGFTIINTRKSNPLVSDTDNSSNAFINRGGLLVSHYDTELIEALQSYHFEDGTRKKLVKYTDAKYSHIDGLGDCIRYGIHHLFPVQHDSWEGAEYVSTDPNMQRRMQPGLDHVPHSPLFKGGPTWEEIMGNAEQDVDHVIW
jgi:hypothetical protein